MADPTPSDDGTHVMPSGHKPPLAASGEGAIPARIGRYEVRALLGEGAFGRVFLAFDAELERQVAIKVPKPEGFTPDMRERFVREARATAKIHHPNVCPVLDVGHEGDVPYIVMHYLPGTTLGAHLDKWKALPPQQAVLLAQKLAQGMAAAHEKGVIHRDLKPQNVLYDPTRQLVLITDFGLARIGTQSHATAAGAVFGTPLYMSPEQARGDTDAVGPLSDVYSLGVILYRMLVGGVPFDGSVYEVLIKHNETPPVAPSLARRGLDARLDGLVLKAMAKRPADRYPSAKAFADALGEYARAGDSSWPKPLVSDADRKSSAAVPAINVPPIPPPPLAPRPAAKSNPPARAVSPLPPPPTVPLPPPEAARRPVLPPRKALDADDGAIRQKVMIAGVGLLFLLMIVGVVAVLATSKTQPTAAKIEPAPPDPTPTPAPAPAPAPAPVPTPAPEPKVEPKGVASNRLDYAAERRAAEWLLANGGEVSITPRIGNPRPVTHKSELPAEFTVSKFELRNKPSLTEADMVANLAGLTGPLEASFNEVGQLSDDVIKVLARVPNLTGVIVFRASRVTNDSLAALVGHPAITDADFQMTSIDRAGIKHLTTLPALRRLALAVPETDDWLPDLAPLTELTRLELLASGPRYLTARGLPHLKPFQKVKRLNLFGLNVTDDWLKLILDAGKWPLLEELELRETSIEGPGLAHLKDYPKVDWVSLSRSRVRDEGLVHIGAAPRVVWVYLNNTTVGDDGLSGLAKNDELRSLELQNNKKITDKGVAALAACKRLEYLDLMNTDVTDAGAKALVACKQLKRLTLTGTPVTAKMVQTIKDALPACNVIHADPKAAAAPAIDPKKLVGKWERQGATKATFAWEFGADGKAVMTNDLAAGTPTPGTYTLDGDTLTVDGGKAKGPAKTVFTVVSLTDQELELKPGAGAVVLFKRVKP